MVKNRENICVYVLEKNLKRKSESMDQKWKKYTTETSEKVWEV